MTGLGAEIEVVRAVQPVRVAGRVGAVRGLTLLVEGLPAPVGSLVTVRAGSSAGAATAADRPGEVVGFDGRKAIVMLLGQTAGVGPGDEVIAEQATPTVMVGPQLLGRVINGLGRPIDGGGEVLGLAPTLLTPPPVGPLARSRIEKPMPTGVRVIDTMTTIGRGQRIGVFAGPGVGKSTLLGSIARHTAADASVIALIGERGREVRDFLEDALGPEGLARSVVVVATSDDSPLLRIRAALTACAVAERLRADGADVMLLMDSVTRFAQAQRQVGLAVGEPPATKGYTPSVFASLPQLLERAGSVRGAGSITGFYAVLVEGDDMTEPIADAARGVLDGHIILSRAIAHRGHFPAVDVLDSVSRVAGDVTDAAHQHARRMIVRLLAAHKEVEDLVQIGAYARGSNPTADVAIALKPKIDEFLQQDPRSWEPYEDGVKKLLALAMEAGTMLQQAQQQAGQVARRAG